MFLWHFLYFSRLMWAMLRVVACWKFCWNVFNTLPSADIRKNMHTWKFTPSTLWYIGQLHEALHIFSGWFHSVRSNRDTTLTKTKFNRFSYFVLKCYLPRENAWTTSRRTGNPRDRNVYYNMQNITCDRIKRTMFLHV